MASESFKQVPPPDRPFDAYEPTAQEPWDARRAGHLLRRAGFGASPDAMKQAIEAGPGKAVDRLFDFNPEDDPFNHLLDQGAGLVSLRENNQAAEWWIFRMLNTPRPLQEKVAVYWHNHFATSGSKIYSGYVMAAQIELFRRKGLGSFRDLLVEVGWNPAMLWWLDGNNSNKGGPNENYGREVMELFTLGVGNYSEQDVKELSRAFTGWRLEGDDKHKRAEFRKDDFDDGEKTIFGQKGKYDSESAVDLLLTRPAAPKHLARKLLRDFVRPEPTDEQVEHYAKRLVDLKWEIKPVLREMLGSRLFYSEWAYRSRVKSPVELCVGAALSVGGGSKAKANYLRDQMERMGQKLLFPPNVKGWDGDTNWINANTVITRFNFAMNLYKSENYIFEDTADLPQQMREKGDVTPEAIVKYFADLLLDGRLPEARRRELQTFMPQYGDKPPVEKFDLNDGRAQAKVRSVVHLMTTSPAYQLA